MKLRHLLLVAIFPLFLGSCGYNSMVTKQEQVKEQLGNMQGAYQRRADLIPNLVSTVKGVANFEQTTLTQVIEARSKATSIQLDASKLDENSMKQFQQAQEQLKGSLSRLLVVAESYPQLKANQNFLELQSQLEGTENRINVERRRFNEVVKDYNAYIKRFPNNMIAKMFSFEESPYFQADAGSEKAPKVEF